MSKLNIIFNGTDYSIDESALASAKDSLKTHLSTVMKGSGGLEPITWDGVVGDKFTVGSLVKVSDTVLSREDFVGSTITISNGESLLIDENLVFSQVLTEEGAIFIGVGEMNVVSITQDILVDSELAYEAGTYFSNNPNNGLYTNSITFPTGSTSGSTTITFDGTSYQVDPTKFQVATDNFVAHISTLTGGGLEPITWDGVVGDRVTGSCIFMNNEALLVKVSNRVLSSDDIASATMGIYHNGDITEGPADDGFVPYQGVNTVGWYMLVSASEAKENFDATGGGTLVFTLPEPGTYFAYVDNSNGIMYVQSITLADGSGDASQGGDTKLTIGGVDYMVDSANLDTAIANLHATLNRLSSGAGEDTPSELVLEGDGASYYTLAPTTLTFRSEAPLNEFKEVQVNGQTLDPSNYTLEEGSTIVTLATNYLKNLNVGGHDISVVSEKGTASGGFSVEAPELNGHGFYYNQPYSADLPAFGGRTAMIVHPDNTYTITTVGQAASKGEYTLDGNNIVASHPMTGVLHSTISSDGLSIYCVELDATFTLNSNTDIASDKDCIYIYDETLGGYDVRAMNPDAKDIKIRTGIYGIDTVSISRFAFFDYSDTLHITIPNTVTSIGEYAFYWCSGLTSITIPSGVTSIGDHAFYSCSGLTSITIPSGMTDIGNHAFSACSGLTSITISDSVAVIGDGAFNGTPVENVTFTGTVNQWNSISKGQSWCNFTDTPNPATYVQCSDGQVTL